MLMGGSTEQELQMKKKTVYKVFTMQTKISYGNVPISRNNIDSPAQIQISQNVLWYCTALHYRFHECQHYRKRYSESEEQISQINFNKNDVQGQKKSRVDGMTQGRRTEHCPRRTVEQGVCSLPNTSWR